MRTPNIGSISFTPGEVPADLLGLQRYVRDLEIRVGATIAALAAGHLDKTTVAPAKPRDGDIRYASGAGGWDPLGTGAGIYWYNGATSAWVKL